MPEPPSPQDTRSKTVVAYLDGRRLKGYVYNFSPANDRFKLFPRDDAPNSRGTEVHFKDLKAVFFVKDYDGNKDRKKSNEFTAENHAVGRKIKVVFKDNETLVGTTQGYQPGRSGFFVFPADSHSNNERCYVVSTAAKEVSLL